MKLMMPETQALWDDCVHPVTIRSNVTAREIRTWLRANIPRHSSGFFPYIVAEYRVYFADAKHATACALKWA